MSQSKFKNSPNYRKKKSPWPLAILAVGSLLLILGAFFAFSQSSKTKAAIEITGSPSLKVDKEEVNLGDVKIGQKVKVSFLLTNVGDQVLNFDKTPFIEVKDGCCPPTPTIGSMAVKPGESTMLSLEFTMMAHGGMDGPHDFRVHLPTNDTSWGDKTLAVLSNWIQ